MQLRTILQGLVLILLFFIYPSTNLVWASNANYDFQTYCTVERIPFKEFKRSVGAPLLYSYSKPDRLELTGFLFKDKMGSLRVSYSSGLNFSPSSKGRTKNSYFKYTKQFILSDNKLLPTKAKGCDAEYKSNGWLFSVTNGTAVASKGDKVKSIKIAGNTSWSFAESQGSVFVGTNLGEALRFKGGEWCEMYLVQETYVCPKGGTKSQLLGRQFYSSLSLGKFSLIGDYPNGWVWKFDGETLTKDVRFTPPKYMSNFITPGFEVQTLATYCGSLYLGIWPYGELLRYDGYSWSEPFSLFPSVDFEPPDFPFEEISKKIHEDLNFLGRRIPSMVVEDGSLFIITSNKWPHKTQNNVPLPNYFKREYGAVHKISDPFCLNADQLSSLKESQFSKLSPKQISELRPEQVSRLTPNQISRMKLTSIAHMKPVTFQTLSDFQLSELTFAQIKYLKSMLGKHA